MSSNNSQKIVARSNLRLLDMLDEKSLSAIKKFGFVYKDKYTGKTRIRIYNK